MRHYVLCISFLMIPEYVLCLSDNVEQKDIKKSVDARDTTESKDIIGNDESLVGRFYAKLFGSSADDLVQQSLPDDQDLDDEDEEEDDSVLDVIIENHPGKTAATIVGVGLLAAKLYSAASATKKQSKSSQGHPESKGTSNSTGNPPQGLPTDPMPHVENNNAKIEEQEGEEEKKELKRKNDEKYVESQEPAQGFEKRLINSRLPKLFAKQMTKVAKKADGTISLMGQKMPYWIAEFDRPGNKNFKKIKYWLLENALLTFSLAQVLDGVCFVSIDFYNPKEATIVHGHTVKILSKRLQKYLKSTEQFCSWRTDGLIVSGLVEFHEKNHAKNVRKLDINTLRIYTPVVFPVTQKNLFRQTVFAQLVAIPTENKVDDQPIYAPHLKMIEEGK